MNTKRILSWGTFIIIVGLVIWGLIAASQKASREALGLPLPDQITASDWVRGNPEAPVTLVEYGDFQCPACASYSPIVERLYNESSSTMRMVFRHFPLSQHPNAGPAAQAAEAAGKQGKFWEMYDMLYSKQKDWENSTDAKTIFVEYAKNLDLDLTKYAVDVDSKEIKDEIDLDYKGGVKAKINSTPTFYVNGVKISNPQDYEEFKKIIDDAATSKIKS